MKIVDKIVNNTKPNRFLGLNIVITCLTIFFLAIGVVFVVDEIVPSDKNELKTTTGIVSNFKQRDPQWYDYFFTDSGSISYFKLWFTDGSFYEATGVYYDNIDRNLYETLQAGDKITISFVDNGWSEPNDIISIEHNGICYQSADDVIKDYESTRKSNRIFGFCLIGITTLGAITSYILNYLKNKQKKQDCNPQTQTP